MKQGSIPHPQREICQQKVSYSFRIYLRHEINVTIFTNILLKKHSKNVVFFHPLWYYIQRAQK